METRVRRLTSRDRAAARSLFQVLAAIFEEPPVAPSDAWIDELLGRPDFFAIVAEVDGEVVGGITAHAIPMTSSERAELFIYDVGVQQEHQRSGIGRRLIEHTRRSAREDGIPGAFVAADNLDEHALAFYRSVGGVPSPVTIFSFDTSISNS